MTKAEYYKEYDVDLSALEKWEIELVKELKEVVSLCGVIYGKQKNVEYEGGNFYDHTLTKSEIEKASKTDPNVLNHFTVVKKDATGKITAVPYYVEYKEEIAEMKKHLIKAAEIHRDPKYKAYLLKFADDLDGTEYLESEKLWLQLNGSRIDIRLGPIETYNDKLFGLKRAFQANLRILNEREQKYVNDYIQVIVELQPASPFSVQNPEKNLKVRVDNIIAIGGWHADLVPRGSNYPDDLELSDCGVKVLIYDNTTRIVNENLYKLAKEVIDDKEFSKIDKEKFLANATRFVLFHEISEAIAKLRYPDFEERLVSTNDVAREIFASTIGVKSASIQVLKGILTFDDYRNLLMIYILEAIWQWYKSSKKGRAVGTYAAGFRIAIAYLLENNALCTDDSDKVELDYPSLYSQIDNFSNICLNLMKEQYEKDAQALISKYDGSDYLAKYSKFISYEF